MTRLFDEPIEYILTTVQLNKFLVKSGNKYWEYNEKRCKRERTGGVEIVPVSVQPVLNGFLMDVKPFQISGCLQ